MSEPQLGEQCLRRAHEDPLAIVRELTGGYGADIYIEGTGHPSAVPQGLNILRKLGTDVEYSDDKELDVLGAHTWPKAIQMIEACTLPMADICSTQVPRSRFQESLDLVSDSQKSVKVTLLPD